MTIIHPTNGRIVWFQKGEQQHHIVQRGQPLAAMVCHVWGDRLVNLKVTDADGIDHAVTSVPLMQQGDLQPAQPVAYAYWMPYQQGQAAKAEAAEARASGSIPQKESAAG